MVFTFLPFPFRVIGPWTSIFVVLGTLLYIQHPSPHYCTLFLVRLPPSLPSSACVWSSSTLRGFKPGISLSHHPSASSSIPTLASPEYTRPSIIYTAFPRCRILLLMPCHVKPCHTPPVVHRRTLHLAPISTHVLLLTIPWPCFTYSTQTFWTPVYRRSFSSA